MALKIPPLLKEGLAGCRSAIVATVGFSFALNLLTLAMPVFTIQLYNRVLSSGSGATLALISLAAIVAFAAAGFLEDIRAQLLVGIGCRLDAALSGPLFSRLVEASVRTGGLAQGQTLRDLDTLRTTLTGGGALALLDLPWTPLFIIGCAMLHPLLGLLSLVGTGVLIGLALLNQAAVAQPLSESARQGEASYGLTDAVIRNAEVVQAMGMLPAILGGWRGLRAGLMHQQSLASIRNSQVGSLIKFVRMLLQIAIFAAGAWLVVDQKLSAGALFASSLLTTRALAPIDQIVGVWRQLVVGVASLRRVESAFAVPDRMSAMALPHPEGRLSVENLTYVPTGARAPALVNVTFALEPGESLGVVGASAAGKSTLARLIVGAIRPSNGVVRLDGGDAYTWDREAFGKAVGYLPQDVELFDGAIRDNICRFRETGPAAIVAAAQLAGAHDLILRLPNGYDTHIGATGATLSGGQRQRIGLARAVFGDPKLIVLDEPNANLDGEGEGALQQLLGRLKSRGVTVLMIAHRPSSLVALDKVLVLNNGGMAAMGPVAQMLQMIAPGFTVPARPTPVPAPAAAQASPVAQPAAADPAPPAAAPLMAQSA
jgi:ATP-binding cassette subfamily C exporter for protease/lipase